MVVLVSPLDWGLGHSTRCIPIIEELIKQGNSVICACDGDASNILRKQFPDIVHINLKGYRVKYSSKSSQTLKLLIQIPKIGYAIFREHSKLKKLIDDYNIDIIISDNRYGLYSKKAYTIFMTHQIYIKTPIPYLSNLINNINHWFIKKYDKCWIPDIDDTISLSGELTYDESNPQFINKHMKDGRLSYIGILSRFQYTQEHAEDKILAIISGIEPQRSILQRKLIQALQSATIKSEIVLGLPTHNPQPTTVGNLTIYPYLNGKELETKILKSKYIICRSGYSTLLDMTALHKTPILIPTPGQTEQEYLAKHAQESGWAYTMTQKNIDIEKAIRQVQQFDNTKQTIYNNLDREITLLTNRRI